MPTVLVDGNSSKSCQIALQSCEEISISILNLLKLDNVELSVALVDQKQIQELNHKYRDVDSATDVLSFAQMDNPTIEDIISLSKDTGEQPILLGDVVICPEIAKKNAMENEEDPSEEIINLLIHGILHLTGYEHDVFEGSEMSQKQDNILRTVLKDYKLSDIILEWRDE